jgi:hypothetical protein
MCNMWPFHLSPFSPHLLSLQTLSRYNYLQYRNLTSSNSILQQKYCLAVEFERDRKARTITMSQQKYFKEVLKCFNMEECKPIGTPLDVNVKLLKLSVEEFEAIQGEMEGVPYKSGVGSLMYAMVATQPDLGFAVSMVSQFMSLAGRTHWSAVNCIMRYLQGTMDHKL